MKGESFFFVAETDEISNLNLIKDIDKILQFMDSELCNINIQGKYMQPIWT
jgi:hypothetical protein